MREPSKEMACAIIGWGLIIGLCWWAWDSARRKSAARAEAARVEWRTARMHNGSTTRP